LYLPALGRERRIAGSAAQDSFMGTDFTFEEIGSLGTFSRDYDAERLADEVYQGVDSYVLRLVPREAGGKYSAVTLWVAKESFVPLRVEFYNRQGSLEKILINEDLRQTAQGRRSEEHTSELQSRENLVCRLLLEKKKIELVL